ncbi:unnamed protein product [Linum tenue]|uniref:Transmembrane protein n=1 Tax=Linum tenue TaxID=586396 RepID=A0AAV0NNV0_9ROSI|nr:unnamed protein product [Linum tenue]CAI0460003.1 unnamed protein product [Linum tenue]
MDDTLLSQFVDFVQWIDVTFILWKFRFHLTRCLWMEFGSCCFRPPLISANPYVQLQYMCNFMSLVAVLAIVFVSQFDRFSFVFQSAILFFSFKRQLFFLGLKGSQAFILSRISSIERDWSSVLLFLVLPDILFLVLPDRLVVSITFWSITMYNSIIIR